VVVASGVDRRMWLGALTVDAPARGDDGGAEFGDFIPVSSPSAEQAVGDAELSEVFQQTIAEFSAGLGERDRQIVEERIIAEDQKTLQELANEFGVSRERVRQLEKRLVDQLREFMKAKLVDFEYYAPDANE